MASSRRPAPRQAGVALVAYLVTVASLASLAGAQEPAFPQLFEAAELEMGQVRLVGEVVNSLDGTYATVEQLVDLRKQRGALVVTGPKMRDTYYSDLRRPVVYKYKPYTCSGLSYGEVNLFGSSDLWFTNPTGSDAADSDSPTSPQPAGSDSSRPASYNGLVSLWLNAAQAAKTYKSTSIVFSASKDMFQRAHKWTIESGDERVHMLFSEARQQTSSGAPVANGAPMELELDNVVVERVSDKAVLRNINVLVVERQVAPEVADRLLQMPLGHGCVDKALTQKTLDEFPSLKEMSSEFSISGALLRGSHVIELEASATKYEADRRHSDTTNVELARTTVRVGPGEGVERALQLIRHRDTNQDTKIVYDYAYHVRYDIDSRQGSCKLVNFHSQEEEVTDRMLVKFANGLELNMDTNNMFKLFSDLENFRYIRRSGSMREQSLVLYFELSQGPFRIMRAYALSNNGLTTSATLDSVTVWMLDGSEEQVTESYHLSVIRAEPIVYLLEAAKMFDISDECYLNNELMQAGHDYVWAEVTYPLSSRHSKLLAEAADGLQKMLRERIALAQGSNFFQAPKLELMFEETALIVRALFLNAPPLEFLYDPMAGKSLPGQSGGLAELATDLSHCAKLCALYRCQAMSFCGQEHSCLLSSKRVRADGLLESSKCDSYLAPSDSTGALFEQNVHRALARMQQDSFEGLQLPQLPDELAYPASETGVERGDRLKALVEYRRQFYEAVEASDSQLAKLAAIVQYDEDTFISLLPSKIELERDPLREFQLAGRESSDMLEGSNVASADDDLYEAPAVPAFHNGLNMFHFKIAELSKGDASDWRMLNGLSYDQCSIACADAKCNSFSYCWQRQECIVTSIYDIGTSAKLEMDSDCFVAQRDFLSKFSRFPDVFRPEVFQNQREVANPSECAHACVASEEFNCLAFDYCMKPALTTSDVTSGLLVAGTCFLLTDRRLFSGARAGPAAGTGKGSGSELSAASCDHYSRSYLADFLRAENRELEPTELAKLATSQLDGVLVDRCAQVCAQERVSCSAFQFCLNSLESEGPSQRCTLIESAPASGAKLVVDGELPTTSGAGQLFKFSDNCHVFALRRDSTEAQLRELAITATTKGDEALSGGRPAGSASSGVSAWGATLLFLTLLAAFASLGFGGALLYERNEPFREQIQWLRQRIGGNRWIR